MKKTVCHICILVIKDSFMFGVMDCRDRSYTRFSLSRVQFILHFMMMVE